MIRRERYHRKVVLAPRIVTASMLSIATSCALVYDVDSLESGESTCGNENAACCAGDECKYPALSCVSNTCQRCSKDNAACCLAENLRDCSGDGGAVNLTGICDDGKCARPCSASAPDCSLLSTHANCCAASDDVGCVPCTASGCVCKVCCAKCGSEPYVAVGVAAGQACSEAATLFCKASLTEAHWSTTRC